MNFLEVRSTNYMIIDNNLFHPHLCLQCNRQQKPDQIKHITIIKITITTIVYDHNTLSRAATMGFSSGSGDKTLYLRVTGLQTGTDHHHDHL